MLPNRWFRPNQRGRPLRSKIMPANFVSGVRVWRIWRGTGPTPMISTCPLGVGAVHYAYRGGEDELGGGFGLDPDGFGDELAGEGIAVGEQLEDDIG